MGLGQELKIIAWHLAAHGESESSHAALRRSVSTAYYSLFHLLIEEAAERWQGSTAAKAGLERAFTHAVMKDISLQFANPRWTDWQGSVHDVPVALRRVARTFVDLQADRHGADYNKTRVWTATEVARAVSTADDAFTSWQSIRTHAIAGDYLLCMLIDKRR